MLEAQTIYGVREFDIDAQVIGVEFQKVARSQTSVLIDVKDDASAIGLSLESKMTVTGRMSFEAY
jgi:hypothetical protein